MNISVIFLLFKFSINSWATAIRNNTDNNEQKKNVIKKPHSTLYQTRISYEWQARVEHPLGNNPREATPSVLHAR